MTYWVYLLECQDGSIYTGYTTDLRRRMMEHELGNNLSAKYVRAKGFKRLLYSETFDSKSAAMKREAEIKSWNKRRKLLLVNDKN